MKPLSRKQEKLIHSLKQKKFRDQHGLFLFEGKKLLDEAIHSEMEITSLLLENPNEIDLDATLPLSTVDSVLMKKLSNFKQPPGILGVAKQLKVKNIVPKKQELILMLDRINDPGNLGTILRNAAAFGVEHVICSENTVDCYNPKTVQSSMGAIFKSNVQYANLSEWMIKHMGQVEIYAADLSGENIYDCDWKFPAAVLLGSESHGISDALLKLASRSVKIPIHPNTESLNVSSASAVFLAEVRRRLDDG